MGLFALICRYLIAIRWGSCVHRRFTRTFALRYVTLEIVTLRERSTTMVDKLVRKVVKGMLPKNRLADQLLGHLYIYAGSEHKHEAQQPKVIDINLYK